MRFFYGLADEKRIFYNTERPPKKNPLDEYCFKVPSPVLRGTDKWERDEPSIVFRATPDTLVQLCLNVIDKYMLPSPMEWGETDVLLWIKRYGYPHYMRTFRKNMINGRTLLLVDAAALSAMNIKDFDDIRHITKGIRGLFFYEVAKYARSISLPQNDLKELYKLFRVKTGVYYTDKMRSQYWRLMNFVREKPPNRTHWELLERWLRLIPEKPFEEVFGTIHRHDMYACKLPPPVYKKSIFTRDHDYSKDPMIYQVTNKGYNKCKRITTKILHESKDCTCNIPCECHYKKEDYREKWRLACLVKNDIKCECLRPCYCPHSDQREPKKGSSEPKVCHCAPPCECHWKAHEYDPPRVLHILQKNFPDKYCNNYVVKQDKLFSCFKCKHYPIPEEDPLWQRTSPRWKYCRSWYRRKTRGWPCEKFYRDYWWWDTCNEMSTEVEAEVETETPTPPPPKRKKFTCDSDSSSLRPLPLPCTPWVDKPEEVNAVEVEHTGTDLSESRGVNQVRSSGGNYFVEEDSFQPKTSQRNSKRSPSTGFRTSNKF